MERAVLGVCGVIKNLVDKEKKRLDNTRDSLMKLTAILDGLPHFGEGYRSRLDELSVRSIDSERAVNELSIILELCRLELGALLERVLHCTGQRAVLFWRYAYFRTYQQIAAELSYSLPHVYYLRREGLRNFDDFNSCMIVG